VVVPKARSKPLINPRGWPVGATWWGKHTSTAKSGFGSHALPLGRQQTARPPMPLHSAIHPGCHRNQAGSLDPKGCAPAPCPQTMPTAFRAPYGTPWSIKRLCIMSRPGRKPTAYCSILRRQTPPHPHAAQSQTETQTRQITGLDPAHFKFSPTDTFANAPASRTPTNAAAFLHAIATPDKIGIRKQVRPHPRLFFFSNHPSHFHWASAPYAARQVSPTGAEHHKSNHVIAGQIYIEVRPTRASGPRLTPRTRIYARLPSSHLATGKSEHRQLARPSPRRFKATLYWKARTGCRKLDICRQQAFESVSRGNYGHRSSSRAKDYGVRS